MVSEDFLPRQRSTLLARKHRHWPGRRSSGRASVTRMRRRAPALATLWKGCWSGWMMWHWASLTLLYPQPQQRQQLLPFASVWSRCRWCSVLLVAATVDVVGLTASDFSAATFSV